MPETAAIRRAYEPRAKSSGMTWEQWQAMLASRTHPQRPMTLKEMANVAAFVASEKASGLAGTTISLTRGSLDDTQPRSSRFERRSRHRDCAPMI